MELWTLLKGIFFLLLSGNLYYFLLEILDYTLTRKKNESTLLHNMETVLYRNETKRLTQNLKDLMEKTQNLIC